MIGKKNKKALIVRLSSLGDVIFNIPLANNLKENGYEVTWIVSEKGYDILKDNPCVDEVMLIPWKEWKGKSFFTVLKEYFAIIKYLRNKKFDVALDTHGLFKSFIFTRFSGAKRRIVATDSREFSTLGGNEFIKMPKINNYDVHSVFKYLKWAAHLGLNIDNPKASLPPIPQEAQNTVDALLQGLDKNKLTITICPATTWDTKHWNKEHWKKVVEGLKDKYNLIFCGTGADVNLINEIGGNRHLNLAGKTNLKELIEVFRRSDLVISLDSGSTHLAWAAQKPKIISIFCSTPEILYAPVGHVSLSGNLSCQPCHKRVCPLGTNECTYLPSPEEVLQAVENTVKEITS